jgi:hypothetical protein
MANMDRREAICLIGAAAALAPFPALAAAPAMKMWRDAGCGCCSGWAKRVEAAFGAPLPVTDAADMPAIKAKLGVPRDLRSCHTALIGGYVVEGHVPPADIKRLLASRPAGVRGLAVPGMPMGSPGMEAGGGPVQAYKVFAFGSDGRRFVFAGHGG